jgi:hypothetical protein
VLTFGIPEKGIMSKLSGLIVVQEGEASEKKLLEELKHLVRNDSDFQIKQIAEKEYRVAFPDQGSLDTLSKMTGIQLALHGLKIKIIKTSVDPAASSILQSTWVKIVGIPGFAKEEEVVKEIASLVGEPVKVDEFSLIRDEPVRVRVNCRNPAKLRGFIEIFFNGVGFDIRFEAECLQQRNQGKGSGPGGSGGGDDQQKRNKDKDKDKDDYSDKRKDKGFDNKEGQSDSDQESKERVCRAESGKEVMQSGTKKHRRQDVLKSKREIQTLCCSIALLLLRGRLWCMTRMVLT